MFNLILILLAKAFMDYMIKYLKDTFAGMGTVSDIHLRIL